MHCIKHENALNLNTLQLVAFIIYSLLIRGIRYTVHLTYPESDYTLAVIYPFSVWSKRKLLLKRHTLLLCAGFKRRRSVFPEVCSRARPGCLSHLMHLSCLSPLMHPSCLSPLVHCHMRNIALLPSPYGNRHRQNKDSIKSLKWCYRRKYNLNFLTLENKALLKQIIYF